MQPDKQSTSTKVYGIREKKTDTTSKKGLKPTKDFSGSVDNENVKPTEELIGDEIANKQINQNLYLNQHQIMLKEYIFQQYKNNTSKLRLRLKLL